MAAWLPDVSGPFFLVVRVIVALGGVFVGYYFSGPFLRVFWWFARRKSFPPGWLPWARFACGLTLGALLYFLLPLGGGGGWGLGGPGGGGSGQGGGTGPGQGSGKEGGPDTKGDEPAKGKKGGPAAPRSRTVLVVEMLGGDRYPGEGKFYLIGRQEPPVDLARVREVLTKDAGKTEVHLLFTPNSVGLRHSAADRIREAAQELAVPLLEVIDGEKSRAAEKATGPP